MGYYFYDWTYILVIIGAVLSMIASSRVQSVYTKYAKVRSACGMTGRDVALRILQMNHITDVSVNHIEGSLTDHYNPSKRVVNLSDSVYSSTSVAALGVAAHECGHVVQHHTGYVPLTIRSALVPVANFGCRWGLWIFLIGLLLGLNDTLAMIGVVLFSASVLFQIVTLPVEFNASHRALQMLQQYGILGYEEDKKAKKVLDAAAMTYVAAAASSILQLLRLILLAGGGRGHRRD